VSLSASAKFSTNGYISVVNGTRTYTRIPYIEGDVKFTGLDAVCNEIVRATARGGLISTGYGDPTFPTVTLSERVTQLISTADPGPLHDILQHTGAYASDVSTFGAGHLYAVHLLFTQKGSAYGDPDNELKLWNVQWQGHDLAWGAPNTRSWTGMVQGVPGFWGGSVGSAGTVASIDGLIECRRIDQDGN